jgi:hypothetical protein
MEQRMIPVGYMYKKVKVNHAYIPKEHVRDIYSVSSCISSDFTDWIPFWEHNDYWFFDSPAVMESIALKEKISLTGLRLFFYTLHEQHWDEEQKSWSLFSMPSPSGTNVVVPEKTPSSGFDLVAYQFQNDAGCSPLSCNHFANTLDVNKHCLLDNWIDAVSILERGTLKQAEPGPYRIVEVFDLGLHM